MDKEGLLKRCLDEMGIRHDSRQVQKLLNYLEILIAQNKTLNLIGPADTKTIIRKHILDSVAPLSLSGGNYWYDPGQKILDLGTGGGLPGIPLSILLKDAEITLLEKTRKKAEFLSRVVKELFLDDVTVLIGRAEELARLDKWREKFSIVTARAVTKFNILLEIAIPFCTISGKIVFYKSKKVFKEIEASSHTVSTLGGRIEDLKKVHIPGLDEFRALLVICKEKNTPERFPRRFSQIKKKPL